MRVIEKSPPCTDGWLLETGLRSRALVLAATIAAVGCSADSPPDTVQRVVATGLPGDAMWTNLSGDPNSEDYAFWISLETIDPDFGTTASRIDWAEHLRLMAYPSRELVPGAWRRDPTTGRAKFFPDAGTLSDGWYGIEARFDPGWNQTFSAAELSPADADGWSGVRGHVGSFPIVRLEGGPLIIGAEPAPDWDGSFVLTASESFSVAGEVNVAEHLVFTVNGRPGRCRDPQGASSLIGGLHGGLSQVWIACDEVPPGATIYMAFDDALLPRRRTLRTQEGVTPPAWEFIAEEGPYRGVSEAVFEASDPSP